MILDEPFTALADHAITVLQEILKSAMARRAHGIMSTHQLREALEVATDVALYQSREIWRSPGKRRKRCWTIPAGFIATMAKHELPSEQPVDRRERSARRTARQGNDQRVDFPFALVILCCSASRSNGPGSGSRARYFIS